MNHPMGHGKLGTTENKLGEDSEPEILDLRL